ncbi:hypothetical protein HFO21_20375 [Rhizobium laguerreae]|uniref:hypothetical protein n=1 Tax=Rhizobium laguerreae TaxID=1076926 RepID=UPI001C91D1F2|nr:hypothetical protein [Rhizobium laguerreae]MBY3216685.1 hypothetical protein [Rhizobium laguerreae]
MKLACGCCLAAKSAAAFAWPSEEENALGGGGCYLNSLESAKISKAFYSAADADTAGFGSGNGDLDKFLGRALVRAASELGINPAFGFYDDSDGPNAKASPEVDGNVPGTWGTVVFGRTLFKGELSNYDPSGMTILAIIAHEFGHIIQFKRGLREVLLEQQSTVKRLELHADVLAGYYLGRRKAQTPSLSFLSAGEVFHRIGDTNFNSPGHHGTPDERANASQIGFTQGLNEASDLEQVIQIGINHVTQL